MDSAIRIRHLGSDTRLFGSVRDSIARSARKFAYFSEHLHHLKSNLVRSQRFSSREARKKFVIWALLVRIHLLLPLLLHSACYVRVPPYDFRPSPKIHDGGGPAPPVSATGGGGRAPGAPPPVSAPELGCARRKRNPLQLSTRMQSELESKLEERRKLVEEVNHAAPPTNSAPKTPPGPPQPFARAKRLPSFWTFSDSNF